MASVTFRNGFTVSDDSSPSTGLGQGGHRTRFVPALQATVAVAAESKDWASKMAALVYDGEYSAKEYAVGSTVESAKRHASGTVSTGSAKDWATRGGEVLPGLYSAKTYSELALSYSTTATTAASTATAAASQASNDRLAVNQAFQDAGGLQVYFGTHSDAKTSAVTLPAGTPIVIGRDERYNNRRTLNRVSYAGGDSLSLDFTSNIYQVDDMVEFVGYISPQLIDVPTTSSSFGFLGAFAVDTNYLYVGVGTNSWKRITLEAF